MSLQHYVLSCLNAPNLDLVYILTMFAHWFGLIARPSLSRDDAELLQNILHSKERTGEKIIQKFKSIKIEMTILLSSQWLCQTLTKAYYSILGQWIYSLKWTHICSNRFFCICHDRRMSHARTHISVWLWINYEHNAFTALGTLAKLHFSVLRSFWCWWCFCFSGWHSKICYGSICHVDFRWNFFPLFFFIAVIPLNLSLAFLFPSKGSTYNQSIFTPVQTVKQENSIKTYHMHTHNQYCIRIFGNDRKRQYSETGGKTLITIISFGYPIRSDIGR